MSPSAIIIDENDPAFQNAVRKEAHRISDEQIAKLGIRKPLWKLVAEKGTRTVVPERSTAISIQKMSGGSMVVLTDADFNNGSVIQITGQYEAA